VGAPVVLAWSEPFVLAAVKGRRRVLEVGCGDGALAARLAALGHDVTAIDVDLSRLDRAARASGARFVEADLLRFEAAPFDALVFQGSLHHVAPMDAAAERAVALLVPGGALAADDFDLAAPDEATAAWRYRREALLERRGLLDREWLAKARRHAHGGHGAHEGHGHAGGGHHDEHGHAREGETALARWRREHEHEPPLHTGAQMLAVLRRRFRAVRTERVPYLFRYAADALPRTPEGDRAARRLLADERRAIEDGRIRAVGLRIAARR
jgi:SAM-dependent methyltransferase